MKSEEIHHLNLKAALYPYTSILYKYIKKIKIGVLLKIIKL